VSSRPQRDRFQKAYLQFSENDLCGASLRWTAEGGCPYVDR